MKVVKRVDKRKAGLGAVEYILIAIVIIALVAMAWLFLSSVTGSLAVNPKAAVQQFDISVSGDTASVSIVVKNTGNVRITDASIIGWTGIEGPTPAPLGLPADPGRTIVFTDTATGFIVGNQYGVRIQISYANGAVEVLTAQATAHP